MRIRAVICLAAAACLRAQIPNPTQRPAQPADSQPPPYPSTTVFHVDVVARTTQAVNYLHRGGSTRVDFQGTPLMAFARGSARVESVRGGIHVSADFKNLIQPSSYGPEYLTYVLWAISPDGRPVNLGELTLDSYGAGSSSKIETTSDIQTFGMIVTAEPYYAVTQPSDVVVMENVIRPDTRGVVEAIEARFELLPRGTYTMQGKTTKFVPVQVAKKYPFELYEAQNAVQIALVARADQYADESFKKADEALQQALRYQQQKPGQKPVVTMAREAVVRAEDARVIAIRRLQQEEQEAERQAALARENAEREKAQQERQKAEVSRLKAEEETRQRMQAEADRAAAEKAKNEALAAAAEAERQKREALQAKAAAEKATAEANAARQAAVEERQKLAAEMDVARQSVAEADRLRQRAEQERQLLRQQLYEQFSTVLQTVDTPRGLVVNMTDVLFDIGRFTLRPIAREKLARVAGIVVGHPGLRIQVEGHTDSMGSDEFNLRLSENRASTVRDFLISQGVSPANITAEGFGKSMPVADNSTPNGRQANRRVEMVVSGEIIGTTITASPTPPPK
jgi:outer membrane protein OmpA-like peptidoglycan-associated protein